VVGDSSVGLADQPAATMPAHRPVSVDDTSDPYAVSRPPERTNGRPSDGDVIDLSVYEVEDNPFQPRREFREDELASLSESLKEHNILQPILVRIVDGRYQLISGERRLRAAIKANWQTIPARIRTADDRLVSELAIVENLQRKDLNAIEKAMSFRRYIDEHHCTQEDLAGRLKIDRSTIANLMRLLELPSPIRNAVSDGTISAGHARALLSLGDESDQLMFTDRIISEGISVRGIERMVADHLSGNRLTPSALTSTAASRRTTSSHVRQLETEMKMALGTKVQIKQGTRDKGQIVVHYANSAEFERLKALMGS
jgi:ParB family chromosome partitioning protein